MQTQSRCPYKKLTDKEDPHYLQIFIVHKTKFIKNVLKVRYLFVLSNDFVFIDESLLLRPKFI